MFILNVIGIGLSLFCIDKSAAEKVRPGSTGDGRAVDTAVVDVGSFGYDVLHRKRRIFRGRRSNRRADTAARGDGTRSLSARRGLEGRHRGQLEKGVQVDTQLQDTVGQNRLFHKNAQQH